MSGAGLKRIYPVTRFEGEFCLPADKSVAQRAVILGGVAQGKTTIYGNTFGGDVRSALSCMIDLGASVNVEHDKIVVNGAPRLNDGAELNCGNSATCMRLLAGLLSGKGMRATLFGDRSLSVRPMKRVSDPLTLLGARIETDGGKPPVQIFPAALRGADVSLEIPSAQVKSAILLAGLSANGRVTVAERYKTRDHTERMLPLFGVPVTTNDGAVGIEKGELTATEIDVAGDISSAAYLLALGALKGKTLCKNAGVNPTRTGFLEVFRRLGVRLTLLGERTTCGEPRADILAEKSDLRAIEIEPKEVPALIDELPLIALLCAFAKGESVVCGAGELRVKECDRLGATVRLIRALGGDISETKDGWRIRGRERLSGGNIGSDVVCGDHRMAMTAVVGLLSSEKGGVIEDGESCAVSFPNFFSELKRAGACIE